MPQFDYLPYIELFEVLKKRPQLGYFYMLLWRNLIQDKRLVVKKSSILADYQISPWEFNSNLQGLAHLGVLNFQRDCEKFDIELIDNSPRYGDGKAIY